MQVKRLRMFDGKLGYDVRYGEDQYGHIRAAINGSDDILDWAINLAFWFKKKISKRLLDGKVHPFWARFAEQIYKHLKEEYAGKRRQLFLYGHSMGGAIAEIIAFLAVTDPNRPFFMVSIVSYGAPSPWGLLGCRTARRVLSECLFHRVINRGDVVPYLLNPFLLYGLRRGKVLPTGKLTWPWKAHLTLPKNWRGGL